MTLANAFRKADVKAFLNTIPAWVQMGVHYALEKTFTIPVIGNLVDETVYGGVKFPFDCKVTAIAMHAQTAPTDAAVNVTVTADGVETAQAITGMLADAAKAGYYRFGESGEVYTSAIRIPAGTAIGVKVKQVGSTVAGADAHFVVTVQPWSR